MSTLVSIIFLKTHTDIYFLRESPRESYFFRERIENLKGNEGKFKIYY